MKLKVTIIILIVIIASFSLLSGLFYIINKDQDSEDHQHLIISDQELNPPTCRIKTSFDNQTQNLTLRFLSNTGFENPILFFNGSWMNDILETSENILTFHFEHLELITLTFWISDGNDTTSRTYDYSMDLGGYGTYLPIAFSEKSTWTYTFNQQPVIMRGVDSYDLDGEIIGYFWNYGDGTHSDVSKGLNGYVKEMGTSHVFESTGIYHVELFVIDNDNQICEKPFVFTITIVD